MWKINSRILLEMDGFANVRAEEEIRNLMVEIVKYHHNILKEY